MYNDCFEEKGEREIVPSFTSRRGELNKQAGASNTEYILIVVLIAVSAIFMVKGLGIELRTLFSGATNRLNLFDGKSPDDGFPDPVQPGPPPSPQPPAPVPDHDAECQKQLAALQAERSTRGAQLLRALEEAQADYREAMRRERFWVSGHHSRWGGGGGYWASRYVHSDAERRAAQIALNRAQANYHNWRNDWNRRYQDWQSDCGD